MIARNTTFTYRGANVDLREIAHQLGVRFALEGGVQRAANRVRVSAQLIDGVTRGHVWSERYDGQIEEVFDLQDEITRNVVASIQSVVQLNTISAALERTARPELTVWELTMRSWRLLYGFTPEACAHAKALNERALALDPDSAEASMVLSLSIIALLCQGLHPIRCCPHKLPTPWPGALPRWMPAMNTPIGRLGSVVGRWNGLTSLLLPLIEQSR